MSLPPMLQQAIAESYSAMANDPQHELAPFYRRGIYNLFDETSAGSGQQVQARLALLTARQVLPLWLRERPNDDLPTRLLHLAEGVLQGTVDVPTAELEAGDAWEKLDDLGGEAAEVTSACFFAGQAALEALNAALGRDPFGDVLLDNHDREDDLDPWSSDTAAWAVTAWAGGTWEPQSDPAKRREFWHWWLTEAIPEVWLGTSE